jgi:hypothetical protein
LEKQYGKFKFHKRVKNVLWGDTIRTHLVTGSSIRIHDRSQLFTIHFDEFVPIDEIIVELNLRSEVRFAHQPIQIVSLIEPEELDGNPNGDFWNLYKINAPDAWDINTGTPEVLAGMIEVREQDHNGLPDRNNSAFINTDGSNKFHPTKGDFISGMSSSGHATQVAGIIGAANNNGDNQASLGWDIRIVPYSFSEFTNQGDTFEEAILRVHNQEVNIINCSFVTKILSAIHGECYIYTEYDYQSVREGIEDAVALGITVIAATGNSIFDLLDGETCNPDDYPDIHPYIPYPASYPGVIGVSATDINDQFGYTLYNGEQYEYNRGYFIDFSAPGININEPYPKL